MTDAVLFVPGTGGTKLLKNGQTLGHPALINAKLWLLKSIGEDVRQTVLDMSMEHVPGQIEPRRTTLAAGAEVAPGDVLTIPYNLILPKAAHTYPYDWRGDLEVSARGLLNLLKQTPAGGQWKIVTHSQGGLVVVAASKLWAQQGRAFSELVSHITFVGMPVYGTLNSAHALVVGDDLGERPEREFCQIAGTWPALYQMLPSWLALRTPEGTTSPYTFFHKKTWDPYPWIDKNLVTRAYTVRRTLLDHPVTALQGINYRFLLTENRPTWDHAVRRTDGHLEFGQRTAHGDSLVPFEQTYALMSDTEQQRVNAVAAGTNTPEHSMLLSDDWIVRRVLEDLGE